MAIDRLRLVRRHDPVLHAHDPRSPLSVGNGELAFTVDATGLQTFRTAYGVPLCTQAQWGWHSFPTPGDEPALRLEEYDTGGRTIGYPTSSAGQEEAFHRLRRAPVIISPSSRPSSRAATRRTSSSSAATSPT